MAVNIFGDNFSVVNSIIISAVKLQCHLHILNYHRTQEA